MNIQCSSPADAAPLTAPAPAFQRTDGALRLRFVRRGDATIAADCFQAGALRARFPRSATPGLPEAVMINTAGGLTGGDTLSLRIEAGEGAAALLCNQACEKIYKSMGGETRIRTSITLAADAALDWLPQPSILFDRAQLDRETAVSLSATSRLLALEAGILGRTAMSEEFREGRLRDRWTLRRDGRLVFADAVRLAGADARALNGAWALDGARAYANLVYAAPDAESRIDEMRGLLSGIVEKGAASAWNGILLTRLLARDGYRLMRDLIHVLKGFRRGALPRLWSI